MKTIITVIGIVVVMAIALQYESNANPIKYVSDETTLEVVEEPKEAWMTDEEAIQAAKDVIKKKELQAELEQLDIEIKEKQEKRKQVATELNAF